jgi:hypothetical protein
MIRYILAIIVVVVLIMVGNYQQGNPTPRYGDDHRPGEILSVPGFHAKTTPKAQLTKSGKPPIRPVKPVSQSAEPANAQAEPQAMPSLPSGHVVVEEAPAPAPSDATAAGQEIWLLESESATKTQPNPNH